MVRNRVSLEGKTVIVTGANTGIGKETAINLARRGALVIMACRNLEKGEASLMDVKASSNSSDVFLMKLDLASKKSIDEFVEQFKAEQERLDILVNNAGLVLPSMGPKTEDGFEMTMGVNYLGPFYLTYLLLDLLKRSAPSRVVNVSALLHRFHTLDLNNLNMDGLNVSPLRAYMNSKAAQILHTVELARRLEGTGVTAYSLHPGVVGTELIRDRNSLIMALRTPVNMFLMTPEQGAQTTIYCATEEGIEHLSGRYFSRCSVSQTYRQVEDHSMAERLWQVSERLLSIEPLD